MVRMKKKRTKKKRAPPRAPRPPRPPRAPMMGVPTEEVREEYIQPGIHLPPIEEGFPEDIPTQYVREGDLPVFEPIKEESKILEPWTRKSTRAVYDVESKLDRLMSSRKLTVRERYEQMFGEKLEINERAELKEVVKKEKEEMKMEEMMNKKEEIEEFNKFKEIVDNLLEKLNPEIITEFAESKEFEIYEKVMKDKESNKEDIEKFIIIVDNMLGKLPDEKIQKFAESEDFALYEKITSKEEGD